jgi:hypothetical protein
MWGAIALSLLGLMMLAQVWQGLTLDAIGLLGCILSAFALTAYFLIFSCKCISIYFYRVLFRRK